MLLNACLRSIVFARDLETRQTDVQFVGLKHPTCGWRQSAVEHTPRLVQILEPHRREVQIWQVRSRVLSRANIVSR